MLRKTILLPIVLILTACASGTLPPTLPAIRAPASPTVSINAATPSALPDAPTSTLEPEIATDTPASTATEGSSLQAAPTNVRVQDDNDYFYSQLLSYDSIRPVYDPIFVPANESPLQVGELVMGVSINGEAKAYPVTVLRFREMVNDELGGLPILVTW